MNKFFHLRRFVIISTAIFYFVSCKSERDMNVSPSAEIGQDSMKIYTDFLAKTGFKERIEYSSILRGFIIGGDVFTTLSDVRARYQLSHSQPNARQWRNYYIVDQSVAKQIKVYVDASVPSDWNSAVTNAIQEWNSISETQVQFKTTTSASLGQIKVSLYPNSDLGPSTVALADPPTVSGLAGPNIRINPNGSSYSSTNGTLLKLLMAHELGHTIGLMHTNVDYYNSPPANSGSVLFISGTPQPGQDPNSIMNSSGSTSQYFTNGDLIAIRTLYPFTFSSWVDRPRGDYDEFTQVVVTWDNTVISSSATLTISLHDLNDVYITTLRTNVPNTGSCTVTRPQMINQGITQNGSYLIHIQENGNSSHNDSSDDPFQYIAN